MTEDYTNIENKNFSPTFLDALKELIITGKTLKEKIERVFEIGRNEGMPDLLIGNLIRSELSKSFSNKTISKYLPSELKDQSKVRHFARFRKSDDDKNVIVETSIEEPKENDIRTQDNIIEQEPEPETQQEIILDLRKLGTVEAGLFKSNVRTSNIFRLICKDGYVIKII